MEIVLSTLNARYMHASLGLRYLRANLGEFRDRSEIMEFIIKTEPEEVVEKILSANPRLVGFGIYIWNTTQTLAVLKILKARRPDLCVVLGGPEISYETEGQELLEYCDHVFKGEADFTFRDFVRGFFAGEKPQSQIIQPNLPEIRELVLPYAEYSDEDLKNRVLYVEASRGCPYKCEYCLSSLDKSVRSFDLNIFLNDMEKLIERGARKFKFVDRTFNLSPTTSQRILQFFLDRAHLGLFMHFELVPDRLPDELKVLIEQFPKGALQFEIGVQTWNPQVARFVSRRQNYERIEANFKYLRERTGVHTHADLIVGLPSETFESFARGFNSLYELNPDEIQVGLLKRLKGTPINDRQDDFKMRYSEKPPFEILETKDLSAEEVRVLKIFAEFWDHLSNSGRFPGLNKLVAETQAVPFDFYFEMAQELHRESGRSHAIHLNEMEDAVIAYLERQGLGSEFGRAKRKVRADATPARQAMHLSEQAT